MLATCAPALARAIHAGAARGGSDGYPQGGGYGADGYGTADGYGAGGYGTAGGYAPGGYAGGVYVPYAGYASSVGYSSTGASGGGNGGGAAGDGGPNCGFNHELHFPAGGFPGDGDSGGDGATPLGVARAVAVLSCVWRFVGHSDGSTQHAAALLWVRLRGRWSEG